MSRHVSEANNGVYDVQIAMLHQQITALQQRVSEYEQELAVLRTQQDTLALDKERLRIVTDFTYDWEYWIDPFGAMQYVSPSCERITGYRPCEFMHNPALLEQLLHPDDRDRVIYYLSDKRQAQQAYEIEFRIITRSGTVRWIAHACQSIYNSEGDWLGQRVSNRDITQQKQIEEAYHVLVEHSAQGLIIFQADHLVFINPSAAHISGYTTQELLSLSASACIALIHPDDQALVISRERDHMAGKDVPAQYAVRIFHKDGSIRWLEIHSTRIMYQGNPAIQMAYIDITRRRQAEESLYTSKARLQAIFDNAAVGIALVSRDGRWVDINQRGQNMLGYTFAELVGQSILDVTYPDDRAITHEYLQGLQHSAHQEYRLVKRYLCKDGSFFWCDLSVNGIYDAQGCVEMVVVILTDISAQKEAEIQLYQVNQRLIYEMDRLRQRNREMLLLNQMGDLLQTCQSVSEAYDIIALIASQLFVGQSGVVYIYQAERDMLEMVAHWGGQFFPKLAFRPEECQVFQQSSVYTFSTNSDISLCQYAHQNISAWMLCVPLLAQNEMLGVFHLCSDVMLEPATCERLQQLAETVASHVAMALNNLILRERLREQAIHDALTGLFNRHYLNETLTRELKRAARQDQPVALMILDIDYFKHFNDTHGHDAGDTLLRMVGAFLRAAIRSEDIACRYGGEEFILVLPGATLEVACQCAENVRLGISNLKIQHHDQFLDGVTVSLGVAVFPKHGLNDETLIKAADRALYRAKAQGRNCVVVAA